MEMSLVIVIAAVVAYYWWSRENERRQQALAAYSSALSAAGASIGLSDEGDEVFATRLDSISWSLTRAETMKTSDWRDKPELMAATWKDVCGSIYDERVLHAANLFPNRPGYTETVAAVRAVMSKLEKARKISGWVP